MLLFCLILTCLARNSITVGVWNTMRQPWLQNSSSGILAGSASPQWEALVNNNVVQKDIDVLHLVEIWTDTEMNKILSRKDVRSVYPYYYRPQKRNDKCGCIGPYSPYFMALGTAFLNCLIANGTNPREIIQPSNGFLSTECLTYGLQIVLFDRSNRTDGFLCLSCIINSAQKYIPGLFGVEQIMEQCANSTGPLYAYDGESGHLILSKNPLIGVEEEFAYSWLSNRINVYATYKGVRLAFGHFAYNLLEDVDPRLAYMMYGYIQYQQASQMILKHPDVIIGDLNTGYNYQPAAYNFLLQYYDSTFGHEIDTYCPISHKTFPMCLGVPPQSVDHILVKKHSNIQYEEAEVFNVGPLMSDHIGIKVKLHL